MVGRPFWSGQLKISLVSFGIQLYSAIDTKAGITFHQIDRATGQRVRHRNVINEEEQVENSEVVKGFEYSKGKYLIVEPHDIEQLRISTKSVVEIRDFIDWKELPLSLFEKPYFVVPDPRESAEAFAVVRKAMEQADKAAVGEIAFGGREHLVAFTVPQEKNLRGMMAYTLRYGEELRDSKDYFSELPKVEVNSKQLAMANDLIEAYSTPFKLESYKDDYEAALHELIEAKRKNMPLPAEEEMPARTKVIDLMDALRRSVSKAKSPTAKHQTQNTPKTSSPSKKGPMLVKAGKRKRKAA